MIKIGLTGGIGSGKSTASHILRLMGVPVYDTDSQAKRLQVCNAELKSQIEAILGKDAYLSNGELNKPFIAQKIFSDKALLAQINGAVHPAVLADFEQWTRQQAEAGHKTVGLESAILHEANLHDHLDYTWWVDAPLETCIERACQRDSKPRELIEARIRNQHSAAAACDATIVNDGCHSLIAQIAEKLQAVNAERTEGE